jgi:hypothetical protein
MSAAERSINGHAIGRATADDRAYVMVLHSSLRPPEQPGSWILLKSGEHVAFCARTGHGLMSDLSPLL